MVLTQKNKIADEYSDSVSTDSTTGCLSYCSMRLYLPMYHHRLWGHLLETTDKELDLCSIAPAISMVFNFNFNFNAQLPHPFHLTPPHPTSKKCRNHWLYGSWCAVWLSSLFHCGLDPSCSIHSVWKIPKEFWIRHKNSKFWLYWKYWQCWKYWKYWKYWKFWKNCKYCKYCKYWKCWKYDSFTRVWLLTM